MRYALIENNKVVTVVEQDALPTTPGTWIEVTDNSIASNWNYDGTNFTAPADTRTTAEKANIIMRSAMNYSARYSSIFTDIDNLGLTDANKTAVSTYCNQLAMIILNKGYTDSNRTTEATLPSVPTVLQ